MRTRRTVFLTALTAILTGFVLVGAASSTPPPGSDYHWAEPWSIHDSTNAQPPARIPTSALEVRVPVPGSDYDWAQPGQLQVTTPGVQPPAWIPASPPEVVVPAPGSDYRWAQPGSAPVSTPNAQPPASIPIG